MNRSKAREIGADIEAAIKAVLIRHGVELTKRTGSFTNTDFCLRLVLADKGVKGKLDDALLAGMGLKRDQTFRFNNKTYTIKGTKTGRDQIWVIGHSPTGRPFKFDPATVKMFLN